MSESVPMPHDVSHSSLGLIRVPEMRLFTRWWSKVPGSTDTLGHSGDHDRLEPVASGVNQAVNSVGHRSIHGQGSYETGRMELYRCSKISVLDCDIVDMVA